MNGPIIEKKLIGYPLLLLITFVIGFTCNVETAAAETIRGKVKLKSKNDADKVVVYIKDANGVFYPPEERPIMDQIDLTFVPYVLPVLKGTTVDFHNSDDVLNNIFTPSWSGRKFNLGTYPKGVVRSYTLDRLGEVKLLCNIHPDMEGYILVLQNPYFSVTDEEGRYEINNVAPGGYVLQLWYERVLGEPQSITVKKGEVTVADFN